MRDSRVAYLRGVLESLLESLDATVRLARWTEAETEAVPEPLEKSAALLLERLNAANRLAAGKFVGPQVAVTRMTAIGEAIQALDAAFVTYRKRVGGTEQQKAEAALALDAAIGRVRGDADRWS